MRARLWILLALMAIGCGSSAYQKADEDESGHPEGPPANGGAGGTERDLSLELSGEIPPGKIDGAAFDPATLPGCTTWADAGGSSLRTSVASSNVTVAASRAAESFDLKRVPPAKNARLDDFFNYFSSAASEPPAADLAISMQLRARAIPNQYDLFVGLRAPAFVSRPKSVLTVVVDTTPSMTGTPLARAGFVLGALAKALGPGDSVMLLTTDPSAGVQEFDAFGEGSPLALAGTSLAPSDQADVPAALAHAYQKANARFDPSAINRVVFVSDGAEPEAVLPTSEIAAGADKGIFLVGIGAGPTLTYGERLLAQATFFGRGSYLYVSSLASAEQQLVDRYAQVMAVAYDKVHLQLTLPWYLHLVQAPATAGGATGSTPEQYLAPGASLTFLFRVQVCNADVFEYGVSEEIGVVVELVDPKTQLGGQRSDSLVPTHIAESQPLPQLDKALTIESYVEALRSLDGKRVKRAQDRASRCDENDPDVAVMKEHLDLLAGLVPPG